MGDQTPNPQPDTETENQLSSLFGVQVKSTESQEKEYLLLDDLLTWLKDPFAEMGLIIESAPVTMYDYDPTIKYDFYRVPLEKGYLALVYLKGRITESYHHLNNPLPILYTWLTDANPDLNIQAVCFFTDGEVVDAPFLTMINGWKKHGVLRFVDIVVKKKWEVLKTLAHQARVVTLKHTFNVEELEPPPGAAAAPKAAGGGGDADQPAGPGVADLKNDDVNKDRLVQALTNYLQSGMPTPVSQMTNNLIDATIWPSEWKNLRKSGVTENASSNARNLIDYAITMGQLPEPNQDETALGGLLEKAKPLLGGADLAAVNEIIAAFNL